MTTDQGPFGSAVLVLEDGRSFPGRPFGARGTALGEAVFTTGMTGYQETLTDPSYRRQVVVSTAPQIGNTGWVAGDGRDRDDNESGRIQVAGFVIRDLSPRPSNWRATTSLSDEMARQAVVGISEVDTRALTRHLRSAGVMRCGIFAAESAEGLPDHDAMLAAVTGAPPMLGADLTGEVTAAAPYLVPAAGGKAPTATALTATALTATALTVAALDLGVKAATPQALAARGIDCHVLPASVTIADIDALGADGVFLSNGPGDPATADHLVALTGEILRRKIPLFGICFGHQILGRALGLDTYKLTFGHRGINQPVRDEQTGRVLVTAHNHGFAVRAPSGGSETFDTPYGAAKVAFTCLNDGVVEGLDCLRAPAFSVQFHPEAAAGPHDAEYLFDRFVALMRGPGRSAPAAHDVMGKPASTTEGTAA